MTNLKPIKLTSKVENSVKHRIYDLGITDIQERRQKSISFPSAKAAMQYLGVKQNYFFSNRKVGKHIFSPLQKKNYAVRIEKD